MFRRRSRSDDDFREEIEAHIDLEAERLIAEGMDPEEACHTALVERTPLRPWVL